jgi:hypothetical protein
MQVAAFGGCRFARLTPRCGFASLRDAAGARPSGLAFKLD